MRHPAEISNLVIALPAGHRASRVILLRRAVHRLRSMVVGVEEIPKENLAVVTTRSKHTPP
jgi:hypothetical protein